MGADATATLSSEGGGYASGVATYFPARRM